MCFGNFSTLVLGEGDWPSVEENFRVEKMLGVRATEGYNFAQRDESVGSCRHCDASGLVKRLPANLFIIKTDCTIEVLKVTGEGCGGTALLHCTACPDTAVACFFSAGQL